MGCSVGRAGLGWHEKPSGCPSVHFGSAGGGRGAASARIGRAASSRAGSRWVLLQGIGVGVLVALNPGHKGGCAKWLRLKDLDLTGRSALQTPQRAGSFLKGSFPRGLGGMGSILPPLLFCSGLWEKFLWVLPV